MSEGRPEKTTAQNCAVSQTDAAERMAVSRRTVQSARVVQERGTPELSRAVDSGKMPVSVAARLTKATPEKQREVVKDFESKATATEKKAHGALCPCREYYTGAPGHTQRGGACTYRRVCPGCRMKVKHRGLLRYSNHLPKGFTVNLQERIAKRDAALNAVDFETEQAAINQAAVVDIRPTIPATAADLYHQWNELQEPETTRDYIAVCKQIGAGFDRGARRYVIHRKDAVKAGDALHRAGFLVCVHPALLN
jgi:hypothetical protein